MCVMVGPEGWGPDIEKCSPKSGGSKISRFCFPSPASIFVLSLSLSLSWGSFRGIFVVFLKVGTLKCGCLGSRAVVCEPRRPTLGHPYLAELGQFLLTKFGQTAFGQFCFWWGPQGEGAQKGEGPKGWRPEGVGAPTQKKGPEGWARRVGGPKKWGAQNFALFSLSRRKFHSFFSLWGFSRGILVLFLKAGALGRTTTGRFFPPPQTSPPWRLPVNPVAVPNPLLHLLHNWARNLLAISNCLWKSTTIACNLCTSAPESATVGPTGCSCCVLHKTLACRSSLILGDPFPCPLSKGLPLSDMDCDRHV